jgi:hypothetical protein
MGHDVVGVVEAAVGDVRAEEDAGGKSGIGETHGQ